MKKPTPQNTNPWKAAGLVSAISADLVVCIVGGYFLGTYLSTKTGKPGWAAAGVIAGMVVGLITIVMLIKRLLEDSNERSND